MSKNKFIFLILLTIQPICLFLFLRNDPDPFHSGFVYSQSLAVSDGLLPNKNFLSPYGAIGPLLNGLWLNTVNNSLLSLLLLYGLISIFSGYLMSREISRLTSPITGYLLSSVWILSLASAMPWPSILTTLLTLFSITLLIRNRHRASNDSPMKHLYLVPVVIFLDLAFLTRIHLGITPVLISIYILFRRKSLNPIFVKTWFGLQIVIGISIILLLGFLGVLKPFIEQVIVWPLTEFENPPINSSFLFSFIWFPAALTLILCLSWIVYSINNASSSHFLRILSSLISLLCFYFLYYFSKHNFSDADVTTIKTLPGFIKNASVNMQFVLGHAAGTAAFLGLIFLVIKRNLRSKLLSSSVQEYEFLLMATLGVTGIIQLYPLHDNVHLWFVTPLLLVPAMYSIKLIVHNLYQYLKPLNVVLVTILLIQLISLANVLSVSRVPLKSSELQGMFASENYRNTTDRTMQLLAVHVTERNLRNNCKASLFSVAEKKYRSIDGNFSDNFFSLFAKSTPIVDPSTNIPEFVFECGIGPEKRENLISDGLRVVFEVPHFDEHSRNRKIYNVLFKRITPG